MSGIIFMGTADLENIREFYVNEMEMSPWLEQGDCFIARHGNLLIGFCQRSEPDLQGIITLYFDSNEEVDRFYEKMKGAAENPPVINSKYRIYHFFARDPEGRRLEFQRFLHDIPAV
ncbi:MAG: VOC family protein [Thermoplasmatota archaeon]